MRQNFIRPLQGRKRFYALALGLCPGQMWFGPFRTTGSPQFLTSISVGSHIHTRLVWLCRLDAMSNGENVVWSLQDHGIGTLSNIDLSWISHTYAPCLAMQARCDVEWGKCGLVPSGPRDRHTFSLRSQFDLTYLRASLSNLCWARSLSKTYL